MSSKDSKTHYTAEVDRKLVRLNIDISALSEMRLTGMGIISEGKYTIFWDGEEEDKVREQGVGLAVK